MSKQEVWVCRVSFSAHSPNPSPPVSCLRILPQPPNFLYLRISSRGARGYMKLHHFSYISSHHSANHYIKASS